MSVSSIEPIRIVDVIWHKPEHWGAQLFVVINRMPEWMYSRNGLYFSANDSGFYDFLKGTQRQGDAFGGRKFSIKLDDGSDWPCNGDMWSIGSTAGTEPVYQAGISTIEKLNDCYCFSSALVSKKLVDDWCLENTPSGNYYKYDRREKPEYWIDLYQRNPNWLKKVCPARARKLRKKGVMLFRLDDGSRAWSKSLQRKLSEIRERAA